jgi:hypothetical protein
MKFLLSVVVCCLFFHISLNAQNEEGQSVIGANVGFSLIGIILDLSDEAAEEVTIDNSPAIQLTYDYAISRVVSLGAAVSRQRFLLSYTNYDDTPQDFDVVVGRLNLAGRILFHYGGNEKLDLYSGARLGVTNWSVNVKSDAVDNYTPSFPIGAFFAPQLVVFGMKGYITDHIGINGELAIGAPHYLSLGLSYRFAGKQDSRRY